MNFSDMLSGAAPVTPAPTPPPTMAPTPDAPMLPTQQTQNAPTPAQNIPSQHPVGGILAGVLKGALLGAGAAMAGDHNSFFGGFGRAQAAQQAAQQQNLENQQNAEKLQQQEQLNETMEQLRQSQAQLARANAGKAMVDMLHTEAIIKNMPQEAQDHIAAAFGTAVDAYKKAGFQVTEIDDTPADRAAFMTNMQAQGQNMEDVMFAPDPKNGKIFAMAVDPSKQIKAADVQALGKQLGLKLPNQDMDAQTFNWLTAGGVRLQAEKMAQTEADKRAAAADATRIQAAEIGANSRLGNVTGTDAQQLVDSIGTGHVALERLSYIATRNPQLLAAVAQKYPGFDSSKAAQYPEVYKEFTSTKRGTAGAQLNAGATALKHLDELYNLADSASSYATVEGKAVTGKASASNQLITTLGNELATFYGSNTVPEIEKFQKAMQSHLPWVRRAAIVQQAKAMGDKFDSFEQQWKNAAPSPAYEAPMPQVDQQSIQARAALDPAYAARLKQQSAPTDNGNPWRGASQKAAQPQNGQQ